MLKTVSLYILRYLAQPYSDAFCCVMNSNFYNDVYFPVQFGNETQQLEWAKRESQREEAERIRRLRLQEQQDLELALALSRSEMPRTWSCYTLDSILQRDNTLNFQMKFLHEPPITSSSWRSLRFAVAHQPLKNPGPMKCSTTQLCLAKIIHSFTKYCRSYKQGLLCTSGICLCTSSVS